jgi:hypothetical protein
MTMNNQKLARREFFRKGIQYTILSAMVAGTVYWSSADRISTDDCAKSKFCDGCGKISDCTLDQAKKFRKDEH